MGFGGTKSGGRKSFKEEFNIIRQYKDLSPKYFKVLIEHFESNDKKDKEWAVSMLKGAFEKMIPQDITSKGERLNFYDDEQVKAIAARIVRDGQQPGETTPD